MPLTCLNHQKLSDYTHLCFVISINWEAFTTIQQIPCSLCITQGYLDTSPVMGFPVWCASRPPLRSEGLLFRMVSSAERWEAAARNSSVWRWSPSSLMVWLTAHGDDKWMLMLMDGEPWISREQMIKKAFYDIQGGWSKTFRFRIWQRKGLEVWWKWGERINKPGTKAMLSLFVAQYAFTSSLCCPGL